MTAPVRIDAQAWGDLRFATLARLCGFADAEHALIKCAKIWSWQTEHYTADQPTYVVDPEIVESALGPGGAGHLVRARLAEEGPDGLRIRGSEGRIEWLWKKRIASRNGGEATKRKHSDKRGPAGPPVAQPSPGPETGPKTGPLPLSPDLDLPEIHTRARERHPDAGRIVEAVWKHGIALCAELKLAKIPNVAPWPTLAGGQHPGRVAILERVCELLVEHDATEAEKVVLNRVDVAAAKAKADCDGGFFAPLTMFTPNSFATWAHLDPAQFRKPARAGARRAEGAAIGPASPRSDHPVGDRLIPINEL